MTHSIEENPLAWALAAVAVVLICYCRFCRRRSMDDYGGEYRAIAASMTDNDAFGDDISFGENDDYMSDDEEYGNGGIQLSSLDKDQGLSLDELNG